MQASLLDVLRILETQAADALVSCLRKERVLSAARLACRSLRTFIDSITSLTIKVRAADLQRWKAGQPPPPLAVRWPRCTHVTLKIMDGPGAALLALLPFAEPAAGRHVETLRVSPGNLRNPGTYAGTNGEALVRSLVPLLPNLRDLDLELPECMSFDPLQQQLMFSALASLPRLERLKLPGCRSLDRVGALAASLRRLTIESGGENLLSPAAIAGLLQLQLLQELELPYCQLRADGSGSEVASSSGIQALLRAALPESLQQLKVGLMFGDGEDTDLSLRLQAGRWSHVVVNSTGSYFELSNLSAVAQLLLRGPAMGPTIKLFSIEGVLTLEDNLGDRQQADLVQLRTLIQRCVKVKTSSVWISSAAPAAAAMGLLPLLWPDEVTLQFNGGYEVGLPFPCANGEMPGISGPTSGMSTGAVVNSSSDVAAPPATEGLGFQQQCSPPPPGPADLLRAALQHIAAEGDTGSSQQATSSNAEGGTPVPPVTGSMPGGSLLLLQGPFLAMMTKWGLEPTEGVRCLAAQTDAAAPAGNDWGGKPVLSCQAVPLVNGVLLSCSSATAAAAVAVAAGGAAEATAPVHFVHLQSASPGNIKKRLFNALELVVTTFWKGTAHGGGDCTLQTRLRCLLELWQAFNALPEEVNL